MFVCFCFEKKQKSREKEGKEKQSKECCIVVACNMSRKEDSKQAIVNSQKDGRKVRKIEKKGRKDDRGSQERQVGNYEKWRQKYEKCRKKGTIMGDVRLPLDYH